MAKKYIDAERLIEYLEKEADKEFKATEENANSPVICHFHNGCRMQALDTIDFIKQLQQEQCDTCTNDKGCVTCNDGELWEGKEQPIGIHDIGVEGEKGADGSLVMQEYDKQEQPSEDLEVEMGKYFDGWYDDPEYGQAVLPHTYECVGVSGCKDIARHFYELGKQSKEPVSEDLEEAAENQANTLEELIEYLSKRFDVSYAKLARIVVKTANWQKQQMLKDAVDGEVCKDHIVTEKPFYFYQSRLIELPDNLKEGDKVKIVIVKEDKK